ncbi:T9SS type A sorting domain-containing protein [Sungkyunkwania multivorans]|uniref:T9SS type A sorting domain-containing protein n=1 Tax=Sungkyunkwania multivorans TaxID=1173618 RepID=A0ABW3CVZ9_9FLAO
MKRTPIFLLILFCVQSLLAQDTIKTMFYNLLNFPSTQPSRVSHLDAILDDIQPDLFLVCELENEQGGEFLFDNALQNVTNDYIMAPFVSNQSTGNQLQQLAFYNKNKLILDNATTLQSDIVTTDLRDINRYSFILNTADAATNPIYLEVFVTHLKAGNGAIDPNNAIRRELEVQALMDYLNTNATTFSNRYILFAGDFNVYTSAEGAYQLILDSMNNNSIDFIDPINRPGAWNNNSSFQDIHTQSAFSSNSHMLDENGDPDGAQGGMDDRFDFIMISDNLLGNAELEYVPNSYIAYGNNGNCFNDNVNDTNCTGTFSQTIRNHLFNFSDHLPVVMELQTDQQLLSVDEVGEVSTVRLSKGTIVGNTLSVSLTDNVSVYQLAIYNVLGQEMERKLIQNQTNADIDVSNLPSGVYYLKVVASKGDITLKFIKQ